MVFFVVIFVLLFVGRWYVRLVSVGRCDGCKGNLVFRESSWLASAVCAASAAAAAG